MTSTRLQFWMAWRYLVAKKKGNGLSFMTSVSIAGVSLGVAALILVLSVMGGFERDLKSRMLKGSPHLEIMSDSPLAGFPLKDYPISLFKGLFPDASGLEPFTQADIVLERGKSMSTGVLFGIQPDAGYLWGYKNSMVEGELAAIGREHLPLISYDDQDTRWPGIVLGDKLASHLDAEVGDVIALLSPQAMMSSASVMGGATISRQYVVVGIFHTGSFNYDAKWAVVSLEEGRRFLQDYDDSLQTDQYVSGIGVNSNHPTDIDAFARRLRTDSRFKGLAARTWKDSNSSIILALKLEKFAMGSILMLIVLVAAFSISGTMMMSVFHKKRDVSLLRSLGMSQRNIIKLFMIQGQTIALVGITIGLALGLLGCLVLVVLGQIDLPQQLGILKIFPVKFLPLEYFIICLFAWLLSLFGACYPAWTASRQDPSRGLRY